MHKILKIVGVENFVRDCSSNAIINKNIDEYNNYIRQNKQLKSKDLEFKTLKTEFEIIKNQIQEIKELLETFKGK